MAEFRSVSPEETVELLAAGYVYVDVRSEPEFEAGHVPGAFNVPISHRGPAGLIPNPDFLNVMQRAFALSEKLVIGCKTGARSKRAAQQLVTIGFELVEMSAGWDGGRDPFGRPLTGWSKLGLPVESGAPQGQAYTDVKQRAPKST